jgi:hypothetical protein
VSVPTTYGSLVKGTVGVTLALFAHLAIALDEAFTKDLRIWSFVAALRMVEMKSTRFSHAVDCN